MNHGRAIWAWLTVLILLKIHKIAPTLLYTKEKQRKSHKISLQCSERLKPQIIVSFPLPQAMAGYLPSASRSPQPSSLSLLYQSDSSLCFTFLCSLVSRADSKSLLYFESETLDFTPSLQQTKHQTPNTKPHWFSSTHVSPLSRGAAEQRSRWAEDRSLIAGPSHQGHHPPPLCLQARRWFSSLVLICSFTFY